MSVEKIGKIPYLVKRWPISRWYIFPTSFIFPLGFVEKAQVVDKGEMLMYGL
jgi:hypothetical protein